MLPGDGVQFHFHPRRKGRKSRIEVKHIEQGDAWKKEPFVREPLCEVYGKCGGCRAQHFSYSEQLKIKSSDVCQKWEETFQLKPKLLPAPTEWFYRNRMDFVVEEQSIGLRMAGDFSTMVEVKRCVIQKEPNNQILPILSDILLRYPGLGFNRNLKREDRSANSSQSGEFESSSSANQESGGAKNSVLKYITIRSGFESGVIVLTLLENALESELYLSFRDELVKIITDNQRYPDLKGYSVIETFSGEKSEVSCLPGGNVVYGADHFFEKLGGLTFKVPYDSFFQSNTIAFDQLVSASFAYLKEMGLDQSEPGALYDFYSGSGVISALATNYFPTLFTSVHGYDFTESAIKNAPVNFEHFDGNIEFNVHNLNDVKPDIINTARDTRLIIFDPNRAGLSRSLLETICETRESEYLLYISCNPDSLYNDVKKLSEVYQPITTFIADCYPQTPHLEQSVILKLRDEFSK